MRLSYFVFSCALSACSGFGSEPAVEQPDAGPIADAGSAFDVPAVGPDASVVDAGEDGEGGSVVRVRHIFLTSGKFAGDIGVDGANKACADAGKSIAGAGPFVALLVTAGVFPPLAPGSRIDPIGKKIFDTTPMAGSTPQAPIIITETGGVAPLDPPGSGQLLVWTGTLAPAVPASCNDWTTVATTGGFANANDVTQWFAAGVASCLEAKHLYCVEQ